MNRVNIVCALALLGLLISPSFALPADSANVEPSSDSVDSKQDPASNEINKDVENVFPGQTLPESTGGVHHSFNAHSSGVITLIGFEGIFECKSIECPNGTETCEYDSRMLEDGKNCETRYKCTSSNGSVLLETTKTEPADQVTGTNGTNFSRFFDEIRRMVTSIFSNPMNDDKI